MSTVTWSLATWLGLLAAVLTTAANIPQVLKAWRTRETRDLSLTMTLILASGLALWVVYGILQSDSVIIVANAAGLLLALSLMALKLRYG